MLNEIYRLNELILLSIEKEILNEINYEKLINTLDQNKLKKKNLNKKPHCLCLLEASQIIESPLPIHKVLSYLQFYHLL